MLRSPLFSSSSLSTICAPTKEGINELKWTIFFLTTSLEDIGLEVGGPLKIGIPPHNHSPKKRVEYLPCNRYRMDFDPQVVFLHRENIEPHEFLVVAPIWA